MVERQPCSALPLLMPGIFTDDPNHPAAADDFALGTDRFD
jgi:hypothetical protein